MWDTQLIDVGDLWFDIKYDFSIVTAAHVLEQRMRVRCQIIKGSFIYNRGLGSNLDDALRDPRPQAIVEIPTYIREALAPMEDEINITDIVLDQADDGRSVLAIIQYYPIRPIEPTNVLEAREIRLTLPLLAVL